MLLIPVPCLLCYVQTAPEAEQGKKDDPVEEEHLMQLAATAFGTSRPGSASRKRPSQPDPAIPPPPPRGNGQSGFSAQSAAPPPTERSPAFRKRRLPLKRPAVALMSIQELCVCLDSRGINREDCWSRWELVELLQVWVACHLLCRLS